MNAPNALANYAASYGVPAHSFSQSIHAENTGGMNKNYGAQVKAFETNEYYTYIASDATGCYHEGKSQEVIRQFLFVYPDHFVVFDRVASKKPGQKKTWLLHTQHEPKVQGDTFSADHRQGRLFVRTLLPVEQHAQKIGGPGKEFWTGSRNWPVRPQWQSLSADKHLFGCWRMEVSSSQDNERELFLHLIQVGDRGSPNAITPSKRVDENGKVGVEFQAGSMSVRVLFNRKGAIGGDIRVTKNGKVLADQPLIQKVMDQQKLSDYR
jgi:heparin/heparan-sulfate lyase